MTVFAASIIRLDSAAGPVSVLVAEASGGDQLVHSILREFVFDIAWYVPPFVAVALLLAAYSVRRSLLPLRAASARASAIGPQSIALRLPETNVPTEALPLVTAVNQALDRLEQGFVIKRRFTGNAAHELRTPLTIVTAPSRSVVDAVRCAVTVQQAMAERNTSVAADNRIESRIGINLGDVIVEGDDLYGGGVNIATRIEALADPGGCARPMTTAGSGWKPRLRFGAETTCRWAAILSRSPPRWKPAWPPSS